MGPGVRRRGSRRLFVPYRPSILYLDGRAPPPGSCQIVLPICSQVSKCLDGTDDECKGPDGKGYEKCDGWPFFFQVLPHSLFNSSSPMGLGDLT